MNRMPAFRRTVKWIHRIVAAGLKGLGYELLDLAEKRLITRNFESMAAFVDERAREAGIDLPENPLRPALLSRLQGTPPSEAYFIIESIHVTRALPGDVCEFGVAQGETSALIASEIMQTERRLHLFDSFEGLPSPTEKDQLKDDIFSLGRIEAYAGTMSCPEEMVHARLDAINFERSRVQIHKGFVETTLKGPGLPERVSFAYVDLDFYEPIKLALNFLDSVTESGAIVIVDDYDYFSTGAKLAVDEFVNQGQHGAQSYEVLVPSTRYGHFAVLRKL